MPEKKMNRKNTKFTKGFVEILLHTRNAKYQE